MTTAPVVTDVNGVTVEWDEVKAFLDDLRESGATNMFGAAPYVTEAFDVSKQGARVLLSHWMATF